MVPMILENKSPLEKIALHLPPLPSEYQGVSGAIFQAFTIDESVGKEICAVFLDDPKFSRELSTLKPFQLNIVSGVKPTTAGAIGYIIWSMSGPLGHMADYEHMLSPFEQETRDLLSALANQSHIKAIVVDSTSGEVVGLYQLENDFDFGGLAEKLSIVADKWPEANFAVTREALRMEYSLKALKAGT
jgi:hypothetical protein